MTGLTTTQPRGLALQTISEAMSFGKMLANSAFVPKDFRGKPEDCVLAVQFGAELGLGPLQATQSIAVVNGRPSIYGDAAIALAKASAVCEYITEKIEGEGEKMVATCTAKRRGDPTPTVATFAVADAKKAGLWAKSGPWSQYPRRMLQMRARGFCLRDAFPDVLRGLVTVEEAADYTHVDPEPVQATATQVEQPTPPTADDAAMAKAKAAIELAKDGEQVRKFAAIVRQRLDDGFYTEVQAADLFELLDERLGMMEEGVPA
jgi:hypothetical protein